MGEGEWAAAKLTLKKWASKPPIKDLEENNASVKRRRHTSYPPFRDTNADFPTPIGIIGIKQGRICYIRRLRVGKGRNALFQLFAGRTE